MTPAQVDLLIHALSGSVNAFAWIIGLATSILVTVIGGSIFIVWRTWAKRIEMAESMSAQAINTAAEITKKMGEFSLTCANMRAECQKHLLQTFATANGLTETDKANKELLEKSINAMQVETIQNRDLVTGLIKGLKEDLVNFQNTFWEAFHHHKHTEDGAVIRGD